MHKSIFTVLVALTALHTLAQPGPLPYAATITAADLQKHLTIIAGPGMEGRETATPGQKKAAAYIENYFRSLGLQPGNHGSFQQVYTLLQDSIISTSLTIGSKSYAFGRDYTVSPRFDATKSTSAGKLVFAGYGISDSLYNDYSNLDVKNAIVVVAPGEPKQDRDYLIGKSARSAWSSVGKKIQTAFEKGAAGVFVVQPIVMNFDPAATGSRKTPAYFPSKQMQEMYVLNAATISKHLFEEVFGAGFTNAMLKKMDSLEAFAAPDYKTIQQKVTFDYTENSMEAGNSSNVLAVLEGTDKKDQYVFLTAHYDHLGKRGEVTYYGADDDGSGTVSVLEMAQAFAKAKAEGNGPRRTMVFMTVSGEEKGLWGSEYYADKASYSSFRWWYSSCRG
jgi:hypothetical protein